MHVKELEISTRACNALAAAGIETLQQLQETDPRLIRRLQGVGKLTYREIMDELAAHQADTSETPVTPSE